MIESVQVTKSSVRIQTTHDFLSEPSLARVGFLPFLPAFDDPMATLVPEIKIKWINRSREHIIAALKHYVGEDKIQ